MCFPMSMPKLPKQEPLPQRTSDATQAARARAEREAQQRQGRRATILTSGLGDPSFGSNISRTVLGSA